MWVQGKNTRSLTEIPSFGLKQSFEIIVLLIIYYGFALIYYYFIDFDLLELDFKLVTSIFSFLSFSSFRIKIEELSKSKIQRRFMAKRKDARVTVILECTSCIRNSGKKVSTGISRYITQKNRHNTPNRLELRKFCPYCYKHMIHGEIKKQIEPSMSYP